MTAIDTKTIIDGITSLLEDIYNLDALPFVELEIEDKSISGSATKTLEYLRNNNYTLRRPVLNPYGVAQKNIYANEVGLLMGFSKSGLIAGIRNDNSSISPFIAKRITHVKDDVFDIEFDKNSIENNKEKICYMNKDNDRTKQNKHKAITQLNRLRSKINYYGEYDAERIYNCIMKCENYKMLMNLKNTLENTRLKNTINLKIYNVLSELSQLVEDCKPRKAQPDSDKPQRTINADKIKDYFVPTFKGAGNGNINYFDTMINELKNIRSNREFAQVALMIYRSNKMNIRKPTSFNKWYKLICECFFREKKTYRPHDMESYPENLIRLFNYL